MCSCCTVFNIHFANCFIFSTSDLITFISFLYIHQWSVLRHDVLYSFIRNDAGSSLDEGNYFLRFQCHKHMTILSHYFNLWYQRATECFLFTFHSSSSSAWLHETFWQLQILEQVNSGRLRMISWSLRLPCDNCRLVVTHGHEFDSPLVSPYHQWIVETRKCGLLMQSRYAITVSFRGFVNTFIDKYNLRRNKNLWECYKKALSFLSFLGNLRYGKTRCLVLVENFFYYAVDLKHTHTHTHTYIYIYLFIYLFASHFSNTNGISPSRFITKQL